MVRHPFIHSLFCLILIASVAFNAYIVSNYWQIAPDWNFCTARTNEEFFGRVVNFYEQLVNWEIAIIGILLVLCFLYVNIISKRQARELIDEELYSEHFRKFYQEEIRKIGTDSLTDLMNNNGIHGKLADIERNIHRIEGTPKKEPKTKKISRKKTNGNVT